MLHYDACVLNKHDALAFAIIRPTGRFIEPLLKQYAVAICDHQTCFGIALHSAKCLKDSKLFGERAFTSMLHGCVSESGMSNSTSVQGVQLTVFVKTQAGLQQRFNILSTTRLQNLFQTFCLRFRVSRSASKFYFDGDCLTDGETAEQSGLESGDVIDHTVHQIGD